MYLEHYGLAEPPFRITPHTDFFFSGANRGATLEALIYAITHDEGIVKISGEVGSGKTMLCRVLMERLPDNVVTIYLANPSLSREDILYALAEELGIAVPENSRAGTVMRALQETLVARYAEGKQVVVLIDEAHAMPMETLEEIRLLSNLESNRHKLLQLVLFGQPELDATLLRADMRQLRERITHNFGLEPLVSADIERYLDFRMRAAGYRGPGVFSPAALKLIAEASQGLTRRINILADKALLAAFAAGTHQITPREAKAAIKDADFAGLRTTKPRSLPGGLLWATGGALAMLAATALWRPSAAPTGEPAAPAQPASATQPTAPSPAEPLPAPAPETSMVAATPTPSHPPPITLDDLIAASRSWIDSVPDDRWFIQLFSTADDRHPEQVETFVAAARTAGVEMAQLRIYHSDLAGRSRYGVIYGEYASLAAAAAALRALPAEMKRHRPYVRQTKRLKPARNGGEKK
jgi:type II secretory pathway predicted ATPase ExeA